MYSTADTPPPASAEQTHHLVFRGSSSEYFSVWFVNIFLSVITLGLFLPWAKVRRLRYFYGNTSFLGANFEFDASPFSILLSRMLILLFVGIGTYWVGENALRNAQYLLFIIFLLPWAAVRGLAFMARHSSFRNVRFRFLKTNAVYLRMYLLLPPLLICILAPGFSIFMFHQPLLWALVLFISTVTILLLPLIARAFHEVKAANYCWGKSAFSFIKPPLLSYFAAVYLWLVYLVLAAIVLLLTNKLTGGGDFFFAVLLVFFLLGLGFAVLLTRALLFVLFWQGLVLPAGGRIKCAFSAAEFAMLFLTNYLAILFSVGLLIPWAEVRKVRFLTAKMEIILPAAVLDNMLAGAEGEENAFGEELDALEGFDFDIGII